MASAGPSGNTPKAPNTNSGVKVAEWLGIKPKVPGPQGWKAAQDRFRKKKFACFRNCGAEFKTHNDEKTHYMGQEKTCKEFKGIPVEPSRMHTLPVCTNHLLIEDHVIPFIDMLIEQRREQMAAEEKEKQAKDNRMPK